MGKEWEIFETVSELSEGYEVDRYIYRCISLRGLDRSLRELDRILDSSEQKYGLSTEFKLRAGFGNLWTRVQMKRHAHEVSLDPDQESSPCLDAAADR